MLGEIALTFVPSLTYLAAALVLVACFTWTQRRKAQPGYAPLWVWALVLTVIAGFAVLAAARMAAGLEPGRTGAHRKPAPARRSRAVLEET
jgi:hypothetical protein